MDGLSLIVGGVVGALLSVLASVLFQDALSDFFVSKLAWIRLRRVVDLAGDWEQDWQEEGSNDPIIHSNKRVVLKQLGSRVYGSFFFSSREYMFRGRLESGGYLNGEWFDSESGPTYSGVFQLRLSAVPDRMAGKWAGFSHTNPNLIKSGPWEWHLIKKSK